MWNESLGLMSALAIFAYLIVTLVAAAIITTIISMFRKMENNDGFRSWRIMISIWIVATAAPYGYHTLLTQKFNDPKMVKAIESGIKSAKVTGTLGYYRITSSSADKINMVVVAKEKTTLNPAESCVMKMELVPDKRKGWKVDSYAFVDSFKRGNDSFTFPPYW